jgi:hypothetical protein
MSSGCESNIEFAPAEYAPTGTRYALVIASATGDGTPTTWYVQSDWVATPNSPVLRLDVAPVGNGDPAGSRFYAGVFAVPDAITRPRDYYHQSSPPADWISASPLVQLEIGPDSHPCG